MNPEILARVIGLVKTNGDKVVLADPTSGDGVVVMGLEQYEALCAQLAALTSESAPPTEQPMRTPLPTSPAPNESSAVAAAHSVVSKLDKIPLQNDAPSKGKGIKVTPETMGPTHVLADLTQEQLVDKINRDIGTWKSAQERKQGDKKPPVAPRQPAPNSEPDNGIEDEERFFLEPIE